MAKLVPVEGNPFEDQKPTGPRLVPVNFNPFEPKADQTTGGVESWLGGSSVPPEVAEGYRIAEEKAKVYNTPLPGQTRAAPQQPPAPAAYKIQPTGPLPDVQEMGDIPQRPLERVPGFNPPSEEPAPYRGGIPLPPTGRPAYTLPTGPMPAVQGPFGAGESYREPFPMTEKGIAESPYAFEQPIVPPPEAKQTRPSKEVMADYRRRFGPDITEDQVMEMRRGAAREDIVPRTLGAALERAGGADNRYFTLSGQESAEETAKRREEAKQLVPQAIEDRAANIAAIQERIATLEGAIAEGNNSPQIKVALASAKRDLAAQENLIRQARKEQQKIEQGPAVTQTQLGAAVQGAPQAVAEQTSDAISAVQRIALSPVRAVEAITGVPQDKSVVLRVLNEEDEARRRAILGQLNSDTALADDLGQKYVRGLGSTAGFALTGGVLNKGLGLGVTASTAIGGGLSQANQGWKEAERRAQEDPAYADEWRKWASFGINFGIGATEAAPIGLFFKKLEEVSGGGLTRWIGITAASAGEEGLQEGLQQLLQNANSMGLLGDPNVTLTKDVADNMLVGALSGGTFSAAIAGGKMAWDAGRARPGAPVMPPLPLDMQYQQPGAMAPVQAPLTAGVQPVPGAGPLSPAPVEAQGVPTSPASPVATPQEALAVAPQQAAGQPALEAMKEETARQFPPTEPEVQVLLGAGFAAEDIKDMSPQERLAEIQAARSEGVTPVDLTPQQKSDFGFGKPQEAAAPAPVESIPQAPLTAAAQPQVEQAAPQEQAPAPVEEGSKWDNWKSQVNRFVDDQFRHEVVSFGNYRFSLEGNKGYGGRGRQMSMYDVRGRGTPLGYFRDSPMSNISIDARRDPRGGFSPDSLNETTIPPVFHPLISDYVNKVIDQDQFVEGLKKIEADTIEQLKAQEAAATPAAPPAAPEAKAPAPKKEGPLKPSLTLPQFIASMGGIKDADGELKARNLDRMMTGRYGPLVRPGGMSVEDALRAAIDAGYYTVPEREGAAGYQAPAEMIDQFYNDLGAKKRDLEDQRLEAEGAFDKGDQQFKAENRRQIEQAVTNAAQQTGLTGDPEAEKVAADYIESGRFDNPEEALEQAITYLGSLMSDITGVYQNVLPPETFDEVKQGPAPQAGARNRAEGERAERPAEEGRPQEAGAAAPQVGNVGPIGERIPVAPVAKDEQSAAEKADWYRGIMALEDGTLIRTDDGSVYRISNGGALGLTVWKRNADGSEDVYWNTGDNKGLLGVLSNGTIIGSMFDNMTAQPETFATETGAEGKPQLVIPGAEQASAATMAQQGANAPLRPKVGQKDTDGLSLFNDSSKQGDLMDALIQQQQEKVEEQPEPAPTDDAIAPDVAPTKNEADGLKKLKGAFQRHFDEGKGFRDMREARKMAEEFGITDPKLIEEALEYIVVLAARKIAQGQGTTSEKFDRLLDLYNRQPKLNTRTSESVMNQAYSTPVPLAYVASRLAGIDDKITVYEPTAGNGALLIEANPELTFANELNRVRRQNLERQGFTVAGENAMNIDFDRDMGIVIANPPFGVTKDNDGEPITFDMSFIQPGYNTREIDHAISLKALKAMEYNGRAALIIGSVNPQAKDRSDAYNGKAKREFFKVLYDNYNVVDHFTVDGKLYDRQGASWPVDVIVIDGVGKSAMPLPAVQPPRVLTSWEQVKDQIPQQNATAIAPQKERAGNVETQAINLNKYDPESVDEFYDGSRAGWDYMFNGMEGRFGSNTENGVTVNWLQVKIKDDSGEPAYVFTWRRGTAESFDGLSLETSSVWDNGTDYRDNPSEAESIQDNYDYLNNANGLPQEVAEWFRNAMAAAESGANQNVRPGTGGGPAGTVSKPTIGGRTGGGKGGNRGPSNERGPINEQPSPQSNISVSPESDQGERGAKLPIEPEILEPGGERGKPERFDLEAPTQQRRVEKAETETEKQVSYTPLSTRGESLGTLVPVNMKYSTQNALAQLAERRGSIDGFVANRLGYDPDKLGDYFSAEQIDAIGLAIDNLERGSGFIIGDQTGIGKGRVNAAIIRYALKTKRIPIFVTEKPNLYGDMYRDLHDIGIDEFLGREPNLFMTNAKETILLNDEGKELTSLKASEQNELLEAMAKAQNIGKIDVVFTTYNQMQTVKGAETERQRFLKAIAPKSILILDESHNAGGQGAAAKKGKEGGGMNRAVFVRNLVAEAQGVFYSSATYAKRPDVMDLYSKTDMRLAVDTMEQLTEAIQRGGIPMQQVVAAQLAEAGQYIRRERSFAGVTYDTPEVSVERKIYDNTSRALEKIQNFSKAVKDATSAISNAVKAEAEMVSESGSTGGAGAESTNFTSIMHNLINQMLLSMKSSIAAQMAIETLQMDEKPVITVANTMESFLKEYQEETGAKPGDVVDMDFGDLLKRYVEKTRTISIKKPFQKGKAEKKYLTDAELGKKGVALYDDAIKYIDSLDFGSMPVSPIDALKATLEKAGYKVGEITGRNVVLDYNKGKLPVLATRGSKETSPKGRSKTISEFNNGNIDVMILNQAGATGLSLHAKADFKDRRKRHMIIAQPEGNVDVHMQVLGRVHRTGQVVVPRYSQIIANIPAEKRPAAILSKKMASLSANTTGARKGALSSEKVLDFMNKYGDMIAALLLSENPELAQRLDIELPEKGIPDDLIRKVTGRIPLLKLKEQEEVYEVLETAYKDLIDQLDAQGINTLEAANLDLDAKLIEERQMKSGNGGSPFTAPVNYGLYDVKRIGKPMDIKTAIKEVAKANDFDAEALPQQPAAALKILDTAFEQKHRQMMTDALKDFMEFKRDLLSKVEPESIERETTRLNDLQRNWEDIFLRIVPGKRVRIVGENDQSFLGVVSKVARSGKSKNPLALSTWRATVIIAAPTPTVTIPFSQISTEKSNEDTALTRVYQATWAESPENVVEVFDKVGSVGIREKRVIVTGNLLSGFDMLKGQGTIVNFTTTDGSNRQGILLPMSIKTLDDAGAISRKKLDSPSQVIEALQMAPGQMLTSRDKNVVLKMERNRTMILVPKAKSIGGQYYLDKKLIDMVGDFYSAGRSNMKAEFWNRELSNAVQRLMDLGAIFDGAESDVKPSFGLPQSVVTRGQRELTNIRKEVEDIAKRVVGQFGQVSVVDRIDQKVSEQAAREAGYQGPVEGIPQPVGLAIPPGQDGVARLMVALTDNALPTATAYHEADHVLEMMGAFTPQETKIREVAVDRLRKSLIESGLPAEPVKTMVPSEVLALAFELYGAGRDVGLKQPLEVGPAIKRVFQKVSRFIEGVRNMLNGRGFRTVEDLFDNAYIGRFAERAEKQIEQSGFGPRNYEPMVARPSFSNQAQQYVQQLNAQNGAPAQRGTQVTASFVAPTHTMMAEVTRVLQDEFIMLKRAQDVIEQARGLPLPEGMNAYMMATLFPGRHNARLEDFREKAVEPLAKAMKEEGLTLDDVGLYLLARHAKERNDLMAQRDPKRFGADGGSGMMTGTARQVMADFAAANKIPALQRIAAMVDQIIEADRNLRLASGLISQQTYDDMTTKFQHYVPLRGFAEMDEGDGMMPRVGKGLSVSKREFQASLGRTSLSDNPLVNAILQAEEGIVRAEKNRAAKALLRLAQNNPNPDVWEVNKVKMKRVLGSDGLVHMVPDMDTKTGDNVVVAKVGGVPQYIVLNSVPLAQAYKRLGMMAMGPILQHFGAAGRFFSQLHTSRNPAFFLPNAIRDVQEALFTTLSEDKRFGANFAKNYLPALAIATQAQRGKMTPQQEAIFQEWRLSGGRISYNAFQNAPEIAEKINKILGDIDPLSWQNLPQKSKDAALAPLRGLFSMLEHISQPIEDATRLAVYMAARESGYTPNQAAIFARESTVDFYKRGAWGPAINALYMFYNASIQGTAKMVHLVAKNKKARAAYASLIPLGFFMTLLNLARSDDDPEEKWKKNYTNIPDYERQGYIIIKTGRGQNDYVKIPLAFGLKIPYYLGEQMAMTLFGQVKPQKAAVNVLANTVDAFNPMGKGSLLNLVAPTLLDPVVDLFTNKNVFDRPIVPEKRPYNEGVPQSQQSFRSTSPTAVSIAEMLNSATGGNKYKPGMLDLYPGWIEYGAGWVTGGLGRFTGGIFDWAKNTYQGVPTPIEKIPLVNRFVGPERTAPGESFRYYETRSEFETKANELRKAAAGLKKNPSDKEARQTVRELGKELGGSINERGTIDWADGSPIALLNKVDKTIAEYRKQLDAVKNNKDLTPVARDTKNRQIEGQIERVQKLAQARLARFTDKERKPTFAPLRSLLD